MRRVYAAGFTLIEVMVALAIVALGMSALLETLSVSAGNVSALRDKTVAEWVALNKLADTRLALAVPTLGSTEGDIDDCARGRWHWRQDISTVAMIPGLVSITVSVRRTGNASVRPDSATRGSLGASSSLGAAGTLGSVSTVGAAGCVAAPAPGEGLGAPALGAAPTLGAPASLTSTAPASAQLGALPSNASTPGINGMFGSALSATGGSNGSGSSGSAAAGSSSSAARSTDSAASGLTGPGWLVSLTGFRGNSLAAASGESPDWNGSAFAGASGSNQNGTGTNVGIGTPSVGSPAVGSPAVGSPAPGQSPGLR
jgi:type II secretion system protein I